jgi:hypothetical protein
LHQLEFLREALDASAAEHISQRSLASSCSPPAFKLSVYF